MPQGTIVADNYIDDPNRTTGEVQDALNQNFDYLRDFAAELAALSSSTIREGAVRSVGTGANELPDKEIIDLRLGTTGNLDLSAYLPKSEFDPTNATLVWSGSATFVGFSSLSEQGPGFYIVEYVASNSTRYQALLYIESSSQRSENVIRYTVLNDTFTTISFSNGFVVSESDIGSINSINQSIREIYKA